jgi:HTH-like domain
MIAFTDDHRQTYGVGPICGVLPIAPSTYHAHAARRADPSRLPDRVRRDADRKVEIRRVFEENFRVYGVRKVWRQLRREGFGAARCTVARLMRDMMGLRGAIRGKPLRTTISDKAAPCPLDRVNRQFHASAPDRLWLADFTYVATWTGFVYVAFVIDAYARRIVGWRARAGRRTPTSSWTPSNRRSMTEGLPAPAASSIIVIAAPNMSRSNTRASRRSRARALRRQRRRLLRQRAGRASTRLRSSIDGDRGAPSRPSSSLPSSGWTGSTIAGFWNPSASSRRPSRGALLRHAE